FDEPDFVARLVVLQFVDEPLHNHDAKAAFAQPERFAHLHVANRVVGVGGVWDLRWIEPWAGVANDDRDLLVINPVSDGNDPVDLALVAPFDRVGPPLATRHGPML